MPGRSREREIDIDVVEGSRWAHRTVGRVMEYGKALASFMRLDRDGSGSISLAEFREGLSCVDSSLVTMLFHAFDRDGDGAIDLREFITSVSVQLSGDVEQQVSLAFDAYGRGSDGFTPIQCWFR